MSMDVIHSKADAQKKRNTFDELRYFSPFKYF